MQGDSLLALLVVVVVVAWVPVGQASHASRGQCVGTDGPVWNDEACVPVPVHLDGEDCRVLWEASVGLGGEEWVSSRCAFEEGEELTVCVGGSVQAPVPFVDAVAFEGDRVLGVCLEE